MRNSVVLLFACLGGFTFVQAQPAPDNTAKVHIYRQKLFMAVLKPSIYCDGTEIARTVNGRQLEVTVNQGKHFFYSSDKQTGAYIEAKPGEEYYIRVDMVPDFPKKALGRAVWMPNRQGAFEVKRLKWLDKDKIKLAHVESNSEESGTR